MPSINLGRVVGKDGKDGRNYADEHGNAAVITNTLFNNNMFPDIEKIDGVYYMVFRAGSFHGSFDGKIMACHSEDGYTWSEPELLVAADGYDFRDPYLSYVDGVVYLSTFTRQQAADETITLTGHLYTVDLETKARAQVKVFPGACLFSKVMKVDGKYTVLTYTNNSQIYRGDTVAGMTMAAEIAGYHEPSLTVLDDGRYIMLLRNTTGMFYAKSYDLVTWSAPTSLPGMTAARNMVQIGKYLVAAYRNTLADYWNYGSVNLRVMDMEMNTVADHVLQQSETSDAAYPTAMLDADAGVLLLAYYHTSGASESVVTSVKIPLAGFAPQRRAYNERFALDNCDKPNVLTDGRTGAPVLYLVQKANTGDAYGGKYLVCLDGDGVEQMSVGEYVNGLSVAVPQNLLFTVNNINTMLFGPTGSILLYNNVESRGTFNADSLSCRRNNTDGAPFKPVYVMDSGTTAERPALSAVKSGHLYYDTTLGALIANIGGKWKKISVTDV